MELVTSLCTAIVLLSPLALGETAMEAREVPPFATHAIVSADSALGSCSKQALFFKGAIPAAIIKASEQEIGA